MKTNRRGFLLRMAGGLGLTAVARALEAGHAAHTYHPPPQLPKPIWRPVPPGKKDAFEVYIASYRPL
jgi:hypothetical protein